MVHAHRPILALAYMYCRISNLLRIDIDRYGFPPCACLPTTTDGSMFDSRIWIFARTQRRPTLLTAAGTSLLLFEEAAPPAPVVGALRLLSWAPCTSACPRCARAGSSGRRLPSETCLARLAGRNLRPVPTPSHDPGRGSEPVVKKISARLPTKVVPVLVVPIRFLSEPYLELCFACWLAVRRVVTDKTEVIAVLQKAVVGVARAASPPSGKLKLKKIRARSIVSARTGRARRPPAAASSLFQ